MLEGDDFDVLLTVGSAAPVLRPREPNLCKAANVCLSIGVSWIVSSGDYLVMVDDSMKGDGAVMNML